MRYKKTILFLILFYIASNCLAKDMVGTATNRVKKAIEIKKKAQIKEDNWKREKMRLLQEYENLVQEIKLLEYQNMDLKKQKNYLKNSISRLNKEIKKAGEISQGIMPYLNSIYKRLSEFIKLDMPFLKQEREKRLTQLKTILDDPSISIAEKYRKTMEALFIEAEYGRTVGVYRDKITLNGKQITGNIFRLGRIAMFFQSPDKEKYAVYNVQESKWMELKPSEARDISSAIEIAQKRRPVMLLKLPIGRVETNHEK